MTKKIKIGNTFIGGGSPVLIQSMCNTSTSDADATAEQILALERAGCDIVRVAVPDDKSKKKFIFRLWRIFTLTISLH